MVQKKIAFNWKSIIVGLFFCLAANFSNAQSNKAYGDNMKLIDSVLVGPSYQYIYAIYSGDVNQDGDMNGLDFNAMESQVIALASGYVTGDINGDGNADGADFNLLEKNVLKLLTVAHP